MKYNNRLNAVWIIIICVFSILLVSFIFAAIYYFINYPLKYQKQILLYSKKYNLDASLVSSVIKVESGFDPTATSYKGACGLMQIMPTTGKYIADSLGQTFDVSQLYDVDTNIQYGCYYLRYLFDKFGDLDLVLASYNAGEGAVYSWLKDKKYSQDGKVLDSIPYAQTAKYISKVKQAIPIYKNKLT